MIIEPTTLRDCYLITPRIFHDDRGSFFESFNQKKFKARTGIDPPFCQDNVSQSKRGVLRGLHLQTGAYAQAKLVTVLKGRVQDVCVDLRTESPSFGKHISVILEAGKQQLFVPKGFAHGFLALEDNTIFTYKCTAFYNKAAESGVLYNDPDLNILWELPEADLIISEKDKLLPSFSYYLK